MSSFLYVIMSLQNKIGSVEVQTLEKMLMSQKEADRLHVMRLLESKKIT